MKIKRNLELDEKAKERRIMDQMLIDERKDNRAEADLRRKKLRGMLETVQHSGKIPRELQTIVDEANQERKIRKSQSSINLDNKMGKMLKKAEDNNND